MRRNRSIAYSLAGEIDIEHAAHSISNSQAWMSHRATFV